MPSLNGNKKKILFVIPALGAGGAERVLVQILNNLEKETWESVLVTFSRTVYYKDEIPQETRLIYIDKRRSLDFFKLIFSLAKVINAERPSLVNSHLTYSNHLILLARLFSNYNFPVLLTEHNYMSLNLRNERYYLLKKLLIKALYPRATGIIVVSQGVKRDLIDNYGIKEEKCLTIYNPVDIDKIDIMLKESCEHSWFKEKVPIIIACGRLTRQKNYPLLLKAIRLVSNERKVRLIILGDGELRSELELMAAKLNLRDNVLFLGFQKNPFKYIARATIFVLSSSWEGFGNVIIEAMACRVPVISTSCPAGPDEIITHGVNGLLVPINDEKALAESILNLLYNERLRTKLAEAGRKRAMDFEVKKITNCYKSAYLAALTGRWK